ncbi:hypothetical protein GCM10022247_62030 [Allokutzneria multivorans]|uniref:Uncharacterized protein n=1 Tax=Allokutzneria multivorans TaxID=1142134 RepID=A0ABP7TN77_9PSEU
MASVPNSHSDNATVSADSAAAPRRRHTHDRIEPLSSAQVRGRFRPRTPTASPWPASEGNLITRPLRRSGEFGPLWTIARGGVPFHSQTMPSESASRYQPYSTSIPLR